MKTIRHTTAALTLMLLFVACSTLGIPSATTFNERLATGYSGVTTVRASATILLQGHVISVGDAENVQKQADNVRTGLDLAKDMRATLPGSADDKLTASLKIMQSLQAYLEKRQKEVKP